MAIISGALRERGGGDERSDKDKGRPTSITLSAQQIEVVIGKTKVLSRLIDGTFPNYEQILPANASTTVSFSLPELLTDVKRMHYFAKESNNNLIFTISPKEALIQTQRTQIGRDESQIGAEVQGEKNKIALSSSYLLDFLSHVDAEEVRMELTDKMHPALFRVPSMPNFLHLIMPLRLIEE